MIFIFYLIVCFGVVVLQTTILIDEQSVSGIYDLLIPLVISLGISRPLREGVVLVVFLGVIMDALSGGPAGIYLTVYIWLYIGVRYLKQFLHMSNILLLSLVVIMAVGFENLVLLGAIAAQASFKRVLPVALNISMLQIFWALVTGPFILVLIYLGQKKTASIHRQLFSEEKE
jgi:rod shape-determining protein MreD